MKNFLIILAAFAVFSTVVECQNATSSNWDVNLCPGYRGRERPLKCFAEYSGTNCNGLSYKKYFFIPRSFKASWYKTQTICKAFGFEFATFANINEFRNITEKMVAYKDLFTEYVGVGGITTVPRSTTEWYWAETDTKVSFEMKWSPNEPNFGNSGEYCLSVGPWSTYCFNDNNCNYENSFLCQKIIYDFDNCYGCGR